MQVKELYTYPVKSTRGKLVKTVKVLKTGFEHDRCITVANSNNAVVTGREQPKLVQLVSELDDNRLKITTKEGDEFSFSLPSYEQSIYVKLFRNNVLGKTFGKEATDWISDYLQGDYRFLYLGNEFNSVLPRRGGMDGEFKGYADSSPVHLINKGTLDYLNLKLDTKVGVRNFRPNIVIEGVAPFEEDTWSVLEINGCTFRVQEHTDRCIFTTIDPETSKKDSAMQPLTTLAKLRRDMGAKPSFGIGLVPLETGAISIANTLTVSKSHQ